MNGTNTAVRERLTDELRDVGWPSVAEDVVDGVPLNTIISRLTSIDEIASDAFWLVSEASEESA